MPLYMPSLSIITVLLVLIASLAAVHSLIFIVPIYLAIMAALFAINILNLYKISKTILFLSTVPLFAFMYANFRLPSPDQTDLSRYVNQNVILEARFIEIIKLSQSGKSNNYSTTIEGIRLLFPETKTISGKAKLHIIDNLDLQYDTKQVFQIKGALKNIIIKQRPWLAGLNNSYKRHGIFSQIIASVKDITLTANANQTTEISENINTQVTCLINNLRQHITQLHLQYLDAKAGSLLASMVLGDRAITLDKTVLETFRKVGLSHIVAASGFNLTIITMITYWILRRSSLSRGLIALIVCANILFYALLAGLSASIVRAAIACTLLVFIHFHYRNLNTLAALSVALLINLIADPIIVLDPGAQLSYTAVAGILIGAEPLANLLSLGQNNKLLKLFSASIAVILVAQMSVLPIQLYHFWQTNFLFLPANLIVDPLVAPITIIGFISSFLGLFYLDTIPVGSTICQYLDLLASLPLQWIIVITEKLSQTNFTVINTGQPSLGAIVFYYFGFISFLTSLSKKKLSLIKALIFLGALIFLFYKSDLSKPQLIFLSNSIIVINTKRQAFCFGKNNIQTNKILSFYGASYNTNNCLTANRFDLCPQAKDSEKIWISIQDNLKDCCLLNVPSKDVLFVKTYQLTNAKNHSLSFVQAQNVLPISFQTFSKEINNKIDLQACCLPKSVKITLIK